MPADTNSSLYQELAEKYHAKGKYPERDRFLILAADAAWNGGQPDAAEGYRRRILEYNPNHLLRPYPSFADALKSPDILAYVQQLRRGYPRDRALELMKELDLQDPRQKPRTDDDFKIADSGPAKPPPVFKLADEPKGKAVPANNRNAVPPMLTQSQNIHTEKKQAAVQQPYRQPSAPPTRYSVEDDLQPGSAVSTFLAGLVALAGLALLGFIFVWPFVK